MMPSPDRILTPYSRKNETLISDDHMIPRYPNVQWGGARITPMVGLEMEESSGTTYNDLQKYTYKELQGFKYRDLSERYEYVPLGIFYVDEYEKQRNTLTIKAMDSMMLLDVPYSKSTIDYPATLQDIYLDICNVCGVPAGTKYFTNMSYVVKERPDGDYTCRDILGHVTALAGSFAKFNRLGELEIRWYKDTDLTIGPENRFDFKPAEDPIRITGVSFTVRAQGDKKDTKYLTGTDEYEVDLGDNPLLQGGYDTVLPNILNAVGETDFYPFESSWQGNPALEAGDMVTQLDVDGKAYKTLVVTSVYKYRGASDLSASGTSQQAKGYTSPEDKKIVSVVKQQTQPAYDQLIEMESVMDDANAELADLQERLTYAREQVDLNNVDLKQAKEDVEELNETIISTGEDVSKAQETADNANQAAQDAKAAADSAAEDALAAAGIAEGKGKVIIQSAAPATADRLPQNLWIDTTGSTNTPKRWDGSAWQPVTDKAATDAANAAAAAQLKADEATSKAETAQAAANQAQGQAVTAQATADGKNTVFYSIGAPVANKKDDVWFDTDDGHKMYRWDGSAWVGSQFGTDAIANLSVTNALIADAAITNAKIANLDAGKITTGTLLADRLGALSITADKIAAGAVTTAKIGANQVTANEIASKTITADNIKANAITANSGIIANAAITNAMIASLTADKITGGTITGITVRTAAGNDRIEMSSGSLKAYSAGVRRAELDFDSMDFYTPRNELGGTITATYDASFDLPTLSLQSPKGFVQMTSQTDSRHYANISVNSAQPDLENIEMAIMEVQRGDGQGYLEVGPGAIYAYATRGGDGATVATIQLTPEDGFYLFGKPRINFDSGPYIDCAGGVFRMNSAVNPSSGKTYSGISLMKGNTIDVYFDGTVKHQFKSDGTKSGGSIEIDGKTLGMSPIDSPRVLLMDIVEDVEAVSEGTEVKFEQKFAKSMNGYKVFPNKPVEVTDKTTEGFTVKGEGNVDLLIVGKRIKYEDTYWQDMEDETI